MKRTVVCAIALAIGFVTVLSAVSDDGVVTAVRRNDLSGLRGLIRQRAAVNRPEPDGMTALHWAVRLNNANAVRLLLRAGANTNAANRYGVTPLWLAASNGDAAIVKQLLEAGASPNATLPSGETALMTAARTGDPASIRALLAGGAQVNVVESRQGQTALMYAAAENNAEAVKALIAGGGDMDIRSKVLSFPEFNFELSGMVATILPRGGWTALMFAARQGALDVVRELAAAKADLDATDPDGTTAMVIAIINGHFDLAATLADVGADPNVADRTGMAALYAAVDIHTAPSNASTGKRLKLTDRLDAVGLIEHLLAKGARVDARLSRPILGRHQVLAGDSTLGEGSTPLMRALKSNDQAALEALLSSGADPTIRQRDGTTTVMLAVAGRANNFGAVQAAQSNSRELTDVLRRCLERGVDVNAFNRNGQTALHLAAAQGLDGVIEFLVDNGAELDLRDKQGATPLDIALRRGVSRQPGGRAAAIEPTDAASSTTKLLRSLMARKGLQAAEDVTRRPAN